MATVRTGSPAPTLDDVARAAGVSRATVSRFINGSPLVTSATGLAIATTIAELGYRPNRLARALATRRAGTIAVVVPERAERVFADPFITQAYLGALTAFADTDAQVLLAMSQPGEDIARMARFLGSGHIDGAILVSHHGPDLAQLLAGRTCPVVFIGDPGIAGLPFVGLDQVNAAITATRYLIDGGACRLATVTGPMDMGAGQDRLAGFADGVVQAGLSPLGWASGDFTQVGAERATDELLGRFPDLDGLFVASDLMALGVLQALHRAGRRVPGDVRVVGFDDSQAALQAQPHLTTMTNPAAEQAHLAGQMLLRVLDGRDAGAPVILPSRLVVRESA